jgi:hypothetical protein
VVTAAEAASATAHPLDVVRAGRWTRALFGTYALSLGFFEAAPLRALRRVGANDIRILADVSGVAASLGEAGAREVGRTYAVDAIGAPGGCFHPKFVLLDGEDGPRLVIGSGNLTFGGWGRNLELCEILSPRTSPRAFGDMADFLEALATSPRLDFPNAGIAASWAGAVRRSGDMGGGSNVRLLHSVDRPIADQLVEMADAAGGATGLLVASPYFGSAGAVRGLADGLGLERFAVHVSTALALAGQHYDFAHDPRADRVVVENLDEEPRQRPMHAKLIEIICRDRVLTVSGSVNASGPALSRAVNVELAVVRAGPERTPVRAFVGSLPPLPVVETEGSGSDDAILFANLVSRNLSGIVMGADAQGTWSARLDATGEFRELGDLEVGPDRRFSIEIRGGDEIGFGSRRAILALSRNGRRVAGFVTFPDLLELNRRWGSSAGSMIRVVGGSAEDEDLAGVLEYFARHPDETAAPWSNGSAVRPAERVVDDRSVSLAELDVRPRAEGPSPHVAGWGASAIDRLIAAVRRSLVSGDTGGGGSAAGDAEDAGAGGRAANPPPERTEKVFEVIREAFASRIDDDPQTELHRLADLGLCVLARRPDAARVSEFASWWTTLASPRLRCDPDRVELRSLATALVLIEAMAARSPIRARRRIAAMVGPVDDALDACMSAITPVVSGLVAEATAGHEALDAFVAEVRGERSVLEELPVLLAAIRAGEAPPPLPCLDREPEMDRIRRRIADGFAARIPIAGPWHTSCPRCSIGLPEADIQRLRAIGLVAAQNCCSSVVVLDRNL